MLTRASLLLCILNILATTSATDEYIQFKFSFSGENFSGIGSFADDQDSDNSWCTVSRFVAPETRDKWQSCISKTTSTNKISSSWIATTRNPDKDYEDKDVAWISADILTFQLATDAWTFEFSFKRKNEEIVLYKMTLFGKIYSRTGTLIADNGGTAYFLPNPRRNYDDDFQKLLRNAEPKDLAGTIICDCTAEEILQSSVPSCPDSSSRWLPIDIQSVSSHRTTRIYFNIKVNLEVVTFDNQIQKGSLTIARMGRKSGDNSNQTFAPFRWDGRILLIAVVLAQEERDIISLCQNSTKQISVLIADDWYQLGAINQSSEVDVDASYLTTLTGKIVNKTLLIVRSPNSYIFYGSVWKETNLKSSRTLKMYGKLLTGDVYGRNVHSNYTLTNMLEEAFANDMPNAAIAEQTLDYGYFDNSMVKWVPIHITRVIVPRSGERISTLEYDLPDLSQVPFKILTEIQGKPTNEISGTVQVQHLESKQVLAKGKLPIAMSTLGWNDHLLMTEFTIENRVVVINEHLQQESIVHIFVENHWWQLKRMKFMCWDMNLSFVATVRSKYFNSWLFMIRLANVEYLGRVPIDKICDNGKLRVPLTFVDILDKTDLLLSDIKNEVLPHSPLQSASDVQRAAIALQKVETDFSKLKHLIWNPIYVIGAIDTGGKIAFLKFRKHKELEVRVMTQKEMLENLQLNRLGKILSFDCERIPLKADQFEANESRREVVLEFVGFKNCTVSDWQGETASIKLYVCETSYNQTQLSEVRRFVVTSRFMGSNTRFVGTLESTKILFWIQPSGEQVLYVIGGVIDEINKTISIEYDAKVKKFPLSISQPTLEETKNDIKWKSYIKDYETCRKQKFGMHRTSKAFAIESCINIDIEGNNLGGFLSKLLAKFTLQVNKRTTVLLYSVKKKVD